MVFLHVLAIGCWFGSFYPLWRLCNSTNVALIKRTMDSFGLLGIVLVSVVVFSGANLLWQLFNNFSEFFSSSYGRSEEHTSELQSRPHLVCRLLLEKKKKSRLEEA